MKPDIDYTLYLVTDREIMSSPTIEASIEQAVLGGCTLVQLREKTVSSREFFNIAVRVCNLTKRLGVPLIINDRVDIALAVDAQGVHVGQSDLPAGIVRQMIGSNRILGVSVSSEDEARVAMAAKADYLGVGAMFATGTKDDAALVSLEMLRGIREVANIPIVAIGGINENTIETLRGSGVDGLAVVSAIVAADDVFAAAGRLRAQFQKRVQGEGR